MLLFMNDNTEMGLIDLNLYDVYVGGVYVGVIRNSEAVRFNNVDMVTENKIYIR